MIQPRRRVHGAKGGEPIWASKFRALTRPRALSVAVPAVSVAVFAALLSSNTLTRVDFWNDRPASQAQTAAAAEDYEAPQVLSETTPLPVPNVNDKEAEGPDMSDDKIPEATRPAVVTPSTTTADDAEDSCGLIGRTGLDGLLQGLTGQGQTVKRVCSD